MVEWYWLIVAFIGGGAVSLWLLAMLHTSRNG